MRHIIHRGSIAVPTSQRERNGLRGLMAAVIIMGVLIVAGVAVIAVTIVRRMASTPTQTAQLQMGQLQTAQSQAAQSLNEPPGTHIAAIASAGNRLAVLLTGGGPDICIDVVGVD